LDGKAVYSIDIMKLDMPVYVAGREVRVRHGTPECFPAISALYSNFYADDIPSKISNKKEPFVRFGLCIGHVYDGDIIEFTYVLGVQISGLTDESWLPEETKYYTIQAGDYARIKVSSPEKGAAIGIAYTRLEEWFNESRDWEAATGEYEVYPNAATDDEMELWRPVRKKGRQ
jgi:predicted transcriptional regulator YdeE